MKHTHTHIHTHTHTHTQNTNDRKLKSLISVPCNITPIIKRQTVTICIFKTSKSLQTDKIDLNLKLKLLLAKH